MNAAPTADALVLDYGCVICFSMFEMIPQAERELGLAPGTLAWRGPFAPEGDALWRELEAGRLTEREYWGRRTEEVGRLVGQDWREPVSLMRHAYSQAPESTTRPEALAAVRAVRAAGRPVAVLSNELDLFNGPELRQRLPVLREVQAIVDATYTGILKPDARAYQAAAAAIDMPIERCLMVDDQPRNVEGALRAGMQAIWFDVTRPAAVYREVLARLGVQGTVAAG